MTPIDINEIRRQRQLLSEGDLDKLFKVTVKPVNLERFVMFVSGINTGSVVTACMQAFEPEYLSVVRL